VLTISRPGRLATLRRKLWRNLRATVACLRHPKGMTCLNCGFLALADREVSTANRILLAARGKAGSPPLDELCCTKKLWVSYDLRYFSGSSEGLFDEVRKRRRPCVGFMRYIPGRSPCEHRELEDHKRARREKIVIGLLSGAGGIVATLLTKWLLNYLGLIP